MIFNLLHLKPTHIRSTTRPSARRSGIDWGGSWRPATAGGARPGHTGIGGLHSGATAASHCDGGSSSPRSSRREPFHNLCALHVARFKDYIIYFVLHVPCFFNYCCDRFRWIDQASSGNEDWWFCHRAADVYPWLLARKDRRLVPPPREEALAFSVEMLYHEQPFGVHQIWTNLNPPNATALRTLFHNCPEALHILPGDIVSRRPDWRAVLCDLRPSLAGCSGSSPHAAVIHNKHARAKGQQLLGRRRRAAKHGQS